MPTVDYRLHASAHHGARAPPRRYAKFVEDATLTFTMLFFIEMILKHFAAGADDDRFFIRYFAAGYKDFMAEGWCDLP